MIKTIIFDFGNIFINLDIEEAIQHISHLFKTDYLSQDMLETNGLYEQGFISTSSFIKFYKDKFPNISEVEIIEAWNIMIKDFPKYRLEFIKTLSEAKKYNLILLSNTNELHINWVKAHVPFYDRFKNYFDAFYLSHEMHIRKPNPEIFQFVLNKNDLRAEECLFIDDTKEHTLTASQLGIHTWNLNPETEDVIDLFKIRKELF